MYHLDLKLPVKIEKTIVIGNNRTRLSFFEAELKEVISKKLTIPLLKAELDKVVSRLQSRGLFEYANLDLVLKEVLTDSNSNDNFLADIKITIKEKGIPFIKAETYVKSKTSGSEVGCEVQGALRNIFGCGDVHRISIGTNSSGESKDLLFSSNYPHTISSDQYTGQLDITLKSTEEDNSSFLGFKQITRGLNIDLSSHERHNNKRENKYQIEIADRVEKFLVNTSEPLPKSSSSSLISPLFKISSPNLPALQFAMAPDLAKYCRKSLKVSTKYVSTLVDSRDSMISPSKGDYLQTLCEWATPLGDAQFLKTEVTTQIHRSLGPTLFNQPSIVFSMAGSLGCIFPLQNLLFNLKPSSSSIDTSSSSRHDQFINLSDKYAYIILI
jgi:outer membrane protein assembly factor BamA